MVCTCFHRFENHVHFNAFIQQAIGHVMPEGSQTLPSENVYVQAGVPMETLEPDIQVNMVTKERIRDRAHHICI